MWVLLFGALTLGNGLFALIGGLVSAVPNEGWVLPGLSGAIGMAIGLLTVLWPEKTTLILTYMIATWMVTTGIFELVAGNRLQRVVIGDWLITLGGILSIFVGVLLFIYPNAGALGLVWLIGLFTIVLGVLLIVAAFRLRSLGRGSQKDNASGA
jgi:uncharacterized membrane protein HdeD (DUF308 family)